MFLGKIPRKKEWHCKRYLQKKAQQEKEQYPERGKLVKELDEENGICKNCANNYQG